MQLKDLADPLSLNDPRMDARRAFLDGVKAALVMVQTNRLGQVLCASCGRSFTGAERAFEALKLFNVLGDRTEPGYDVRLGWGVDNPNNLQLRCVGCAENNAR